MNNDDNKNINENNSFNNVNNDVPIINTEQVVINNEKKKSSGNFILIVIVLLLVLAVFNMNEIIIFFEDNIMPTSPIDVGEGDSDNLVDGYIYIGDSAASIKVSSIKFYNFKKNSDKKQIRFNYLSDIKYSNISSENIYIEFYNSNKELLFKELFNTSDQINDKTVNNYFITINNNFFDSIQYAFVKSYSNDELSKQSSLICKSNLENTGYKEDFIHTFSFINDMLISYSVEKRVVVTEENNLSKDAINKLENEYNNFLVLDMNAFYNAGYFSYTVDYNDMNENFVPLYSKGSAIGYVKNNEILEKWECE